jgi:hypothetical protein
MKLEQAKTIVTEYQKWCRGDAPYEFAFQGKFMHSESKLYEATDTLLAAVTVTDDMVERAGKALRDSWAKGEELSYEQYAKAALTAALGE